MVKPPAAVAPETLTLQCAAPGDPHTFEWERRSGRQPKYCPLHRRSASTDRSQIAYENRRAHLAEDVRAAELAREVGQVARLAAGLRLYTDPVLAARFMGIGAEGAELDELVRRARTEHAQLIEGGNMRETAALAETVIHALLVSVLERLPEMPARDMAQFLRSALQARAELKGDGPDTNYVAINLSLGPPPEDGKLTPEQEARIRGTTPPSTDPVEPG